MKPAKNMIANSEKFWAKTTSRNPLDQQDLTAMLAAGMLPGTRRANTRSQWGNEPNSSGRRTLEHGQHPFAPSYRAGHASDPYNISDVLKPGMLAGLTQFEVRMEDLLYRHHLHLVGHGPPVLPEAFKVTGDEIARRTTEDGRNGTDFMKRLHQGQQEALSMAIFAISFDRHFRRNARATQHAPYCERL